MRGRESTMDVALELIRLLDRKSGVTYKEFMESTGLCYRQAKRWMTTAQTKLPIEVDDRQGKHTCLYFRLMKDWKKYAD